jgi:hypothetical protein
MKKQSIKYDELRMFLSSLKQEDFERNWNKRPDCIIKEGHSIHDIEYFKLDTSKFPDNTIISFGMPFLVDAIGNDLSIVVLSKRKYKLPTGRAIYAKFDQTIISDCRKLYGTPLNGYWIIPEQFIIQS